MGYALRSGPAVAAAAALALALALAALPFASASHTGIGEEIPQERLVVAASPPSAEEPAPEPTALKLPPLDAPTGGKLGEEIPTPAAQLMVVKLPGEEIPTQAEAAPVAAPAVEASLGPLGAVKSGGGLVGDEAGLLGSDAGGADLGGASGSDAGTSGSLGAGSGAGMAVGASVTPVAIGGTQYDLVGTLFNGNSAAFTAAVLAAGRRALATWCAQPDDFPLPTNFATQPPLPPGTSSAGITIQGMLQMPDTTIPTLQEALAGPEPGADAVARATTAVGRPLLGRGGGKASCHLAVHSNCSQGNVSPHACRAFRACCARTPSLPKTRLPWPSAAAACWRRRRPAAWRALPWAAAAARWPSTWQALHCHWRPASLLPKTCRRRWKPVARRCPPARCPASCPAERGRACTDPVVQQPPACPCMLVCCFTSRLFIVCL